MEQQQDIKNNEQSSQYLDIYDFVNLYFASIELDIEISLS
jgi:hypothetical protein